MPSQEVDHDVNTSNLLVRFQKTPVGDLECEMQKKEKSVQVHMYTGYHCELLKVNLAGTVSKLFHPKCDSHSSTPSITWLYTTHRGIKLFALYLDPCPQTENIFIAKDGFTGVCSKKLSEL